ncbi:MAG TPA: O-antigen ligase family protein [Candidatus Binataceae bacterium]|nr:O-antigen ligase family protein [Candidatus Binataceae bacterium]
MSNRSDEGARGRRTRSVAWLDRVVLAGLVGLVVFPPLAIGSVNPWAFGAVEALIFLLTIAWMARLALEDTPRQFSGLRPLLTPAVLFFALVIFQLLPVPPALERELSPSTYRLYSISLPGWPERDPYPFPPKVTRGKYSTRDSSAHAAMTGRPNAGWFDPISKWRPVSIAPGLTATALLKLTAYCCLFCLVLFYPLRGYPAANGERRFFRRVLKAVLITGLAIGCIGLLEQTFWNGAILWFYVPYDWGQPRPDLDPRTMGPFVDPDHFAAYLNMILPLALAGALFQSFLSRASSSYETLRVFCLGVAAVLISAIALSLSRGGWIGGLAAAFLVVALALIALWRDLRGRAGSRLRVPGAIYVVSAVFIVAAAAFYAVPSAPTAVNTRIEATITEPDFDSRLSYWRDSIGIIRDFPLLGVGLGSFQDIFPHYQSPPWSPSSVRQAHNDYLELAVETGVAGVALLLWFCVVAGIRLWRGIRTVPAKILPVMLALIAGLAAMAIQEVFDFALQVPGNAVLFTILLALALRLGAINLDNGAEKRYAAPKVRRFAAAAAVAAAVLIAVALRQSKTPYPYLASLPRDTEAAKGLILEHPARSTSHLWFAALQHGAAAAQLRELSIAAWLDPINPLILDRYAQALADNGEIGRALAEVTHSVFVRPAMAHHFYLQPDTVSWLSMEERKAIDTGFKMAIAHNFAGASHEFAAFCASQHHEVAEADVLAKASSGVDQPASRAALLLEAGTAYAQADEPARALAAFEQAARLEPSNSRPYEYLNSKIFAPRKDLAAARGVVERGVKNGADPFVLYVSLAQAYEQAGDLNGAEAALLEALRMRPEGRFDYDTLMRLADLERRGNHFERALMWTRKAVAIRPDSADAFYQLALDEESDYEYGEALRDLGHAIKLAPDNAAMKNHYRDMMRMIAAHANHNHH